MAWDGLAQQTGKYRSVRHMEYPKFQTGIVGRMESAQDWLRERGVFSYLLTTVMVTNYAKRRVKLRIERAKFQFVLIVFCNRAVFFFNFLIQKMDADESDHESYCTFVDMLMRQCVR